MKRTSNRTRVTNLVALAALIAGSIRCSLALAAEIAPVNDLGTRRELFIDHHLIERLDKARLHLHEPRDEGEVMKFDEPWEGIHCGYCTVLRDGERFRVYYRGMPADVVDGTAGEVTCVAESDDGIHWTKPQLGQFEARGTKDNNVVLAGDPPFSHNFSPVLDNRPGCPPEQRYKALGGLDTSGLVAFVSADGLHWTRLRKEPVIARKASFKYDWMFDSQNVVFWSESEQKYLCYFRIYDGVRRIARCESTDFVHWSDPAMMTYLTNGKPSPVEELYTNQTHPYFRAPHLYVAVAARFVPNRQAISDEEAAALKVAEGYHKDLSDAVLMTTRSGNVYDRTFLSSFIRPGIGAQNWVSRTNYPALGIIQTGPTEMSIYTNQDNAQPTAHLHRYSLRLDGFASVRTDYDGGELLTKPLTFSGDRLDLNFSTSAVGSIRVEIQSESGQPIPGFAAADCVEVIGNEIDRTVRWKSGSDVSALAGRTVRLRFVMKDADLFALRFASEPADGSRRQASLELPPGIRERCLATLRDAIKSDEFWPAMHAAEALTLAGAGDEVVATLRERLPLERDDQRRCGLARELVRAGDRTHLQILFAILSDQQSSGRVHAAESLYKLAEVGDGQALRAAFAQEDNPQLRLMASAALAKAGQADALTLLRKQLRSEDRRVRNTVAFALARLGGEPDVQPLLDALDSEGDPASRAILVNALANLGNARGREELGRNLDSSDAAVRTMAAECVGHSHCCEYHARLIALLDDSTLDTRVRAAQSLIVLSLPATKR
jgi:hypothetical protein